MGTYLYVAFRDQFDAVPFLLINSFVPPFFVLLFNLAVEKALVNA
ncbi:YcgL domain-containing protein [Pasteurella multocida]|nr:YcgL domain-containing protein [Pasteurella multocida]